MLRTLLPRFALVLAVTPAVGVTFAWAFARVSAEAAATAGSLGAALSFGAVVLAPSTENAVRRMVIALVVAAIVFVAGWAQRS